MKRLILTAIIWIGAITMYGQLNDYFVRANFEGDYNHTEGFGIASSIANDFHFERSHRLTWGVKYGSHHTAFNVAYQIALLDAQHNTGLFYLENRYLYRYFKAYSLQEFNAMLSFGYRNIHWDFKLGLCNRYIAEIPLRLNGGEGVIFEPMNVVFAIDYNLFPQDHNWNIGCGISNYREFIIERVTLFYYTLHGYYDIDKHWCVLGEAGLHPAGVLNLSSQYNGFFINIGFTYNY